MLTIQGEMVVAKFLPRKGPSGWDSQPCTSRADQSLSKTMPQACSSASLIGMALPSALPRPITTPISSSKSRRREGWNTGVSWPGLLT